MTALVSLLTLAWATDPAPADKDVKAGGVAALVFVLLIIAVIVICISFVKQIRKVDAAKEAGVFGDDEPAGRDSDTPATH